MLVDICCFISGKTFEGLVDQANILAITIGWLYNTRPCSSFPRLSSILSWNFVRAYIYIWIFFLSNFDTLFAGSEFIFGTKLPSECNEETKRISSSQDYLVFERENARFLNNRKLWKVITRRDKENSKFVVPSLRSTRILATVSVEQFYFRREAVKKKKKEALFYYTDETYLSL